MAKKNIDTSWNRKTRNDINDNFDELYGMKDIVDKSSELVDKALRFTNSDGIVKPGSISPGQTTFVKPAGKNLFDGRYSYNYSIYSAPTGDGDVAFINHDPNDPRISVLIPIEENKTYTITKYAGGNRFRIALLGDLPNFYKERVWSLLQDGEGNTSSRASYTFTNTYGARFVLVLVSVGNNEKPKIQLEEGNTSTDYEEPKYKFDGKVEIDYKMEIPKNSIGYENVDFLTSGKNLFNKFSNEYTLLAKPTGDGDVRFVGDDDSQVRTTAVVEIDKGKEYTVTKYDGGNRFRLATVKELPDAKNKRVWSEYMYSEGNVSSKSSHTFTNVDANYLILLVGVDIENLPNVQIEEGGKETEYEEFTYIFDHPVKGMVGGTSEGTNYGLEDYYSLSTKDVRVFEKGNDTSVDDIINAYDELMNEFPNYIQKELLGDGPDSTKIYAYKFTPSIYDIRSSSLEFNNPKIVITSGTHGSEKGTVFGTWNFFNRLCRNWKENGVLEYLRFNVDFYVIPIVNPTGFNNTTRENVNGVDLNRDFPRGVDPNEDYSDRQLETQILIEVMKERNDTDLWIDYHTKNWDDHYFYVTGRNKLVNNTGARVMSMVGRKFSQRHDFLPQDESYVYGYNTLGVQNTITDCNNESGIPAMTLEIVSKLKWEPDGYKYDALAQSLATEYLVNMIRYNLKNIETEKLLSYFK